MPRYLHTRSWVSQYRLQLRQTQNLRPALNAHKTAKPSRPVDRPPQLSLVMRMNNPAAVPAACFPVVPTNHSLPPFQCHASTHEGSPSVLSSAAPSCRRLKAFNLVGLSHFSPSQGALTGTCGRNASWAGRRPWSRRVARAKFHKHREP